MQLGSVDLMGECKRKELRANVAEQTQNTIAQSIYFVNIYTKLINKYRLLTGTYKDVLTAIMG